MTNGLLHSSSPPRGLADYSALGLILTIVFVSACARNEWVTVAAVGTPALSVGPVEEPYAWSTEKSATVAPGSLIRLTSIDPKLNGTFRVDINDTLRLPYDQSLVTRNVRERDLEPKVRDLFRSFFKSPDELRVKIEKRDFLIDVQGLVMKPGQYPVAETTSIDEIIALAGGLHPTNNSVPVAELKITGSGGSGIVRLADYHSGAQNIIPRWRGGERLFFQTSGAAVTRPGNLNPHAVRVIGQVKQPAEYPVSGGATFFTYLSQAGGPTDRADLANITLIRTGRDDTRARTFSSHDFRDIPSIEPGDTIIVNADVSTPAEKRARIASSIASVLTSLCMIAIATL